TSCVGDCNGDHHVSVNELITGVNVILGSAPVDACPALLCCDLCPSYIGCLVNAVNSALTGCGQPSLPQLALSLQVDNLPDQNRVDIVATLDHIEGPPASY